MDASSSNDITPLAPTTHRRLLIKVILVGFWLYVAAIYLLALNQYLHWDFFPSASEKQITAQVQQLGDASLTPEKHDALAQDIVNWNTFAIPPLLRAIEKDPPAIRDSAVKVLQTIALKYYNDDIGKYGSDPVKLKQWWTELQGTWSKTEAEKKK